MHEITLVHIINKEVILMGMLAVDKLEDLNRQELANQVHQMQVKGEI